ncbi:MAG: LytTR family DNA-binding domain-containing protein [Reichenbachiella sp.]|uniref:LytR/AlgR family response regulator transcription factor n=1 Tax=Reichenbachiella sp. TaxID=2184521 RepID=UPI003266622B
MQALIIEDELIAAERLQELIKRCDSDIEVVAILDSVIDTANYLNDHHPDLIFLDIQLSDGICFELFERLEIDIPVIFITAYDEYMQEAFKVNSIDYLLKPVRKEELEASLAKHKRLNGKASSRIQLQQLFKEYIKSRATYKCRFMVKSGRGFISLDVQEVAYICSEHKLNLLVTHVGKKYVVDYTLDQMISMLDPKNFIKVNRNYIVSHKCIVKVEPYFNNRMLVIVNPSCKNDLLVSRNYLPDFRRWMGL